MAIVLRRVCCVSDGAWYQQWEKSRELRCYSTVVVIGRSDSMVIVRVSSVGPISCLFDFARCDNFKFMCVHRAFAGLLQIPSHEVAWRFRDGLYKFMDVPLPTTPGNKVLFWVRRPAAGRSFINLNDMLAMTSSYGLNYTYDVHTVSLSCPQYLILTWSVLWSRCNCRGHGVIAG